MPLSCRRLTHQSSSWSWKLHLGQMKSQHKRGMNTGLKHPQHGVTTMPLAATEVREGLPAFQETFASAVSATSRRPPSRRSVALPRCSGSRPAQKLCLASTSHSTDHEALVQLCNSPPLEPSCCHALPCKASQESFNGQQGSRPSWLTSCRTWLARKLSTLAQKWRTKEDSGSLPCR